MGDFSAAARSINGISPANMDALRHQRCSPRSCTEPHAHVSCASVEKRFFTKRISDSLVIVERGACLSQFPNASHVAISSAKSTYCIPRNLGFGFLLTTAHTQRVLALYTASVAAAAAAGKLRESRPRSEFLQSPPSRRRGGHFILVLW